MRKLITAAAAIATALAVTAPAIGSGPTVKVSDYKFTQKVVHVKRGATVTWKWAGEDPHNVTGHGFKSRTQTTGTFRHRFTKAGTYKYVCTIHAKSFAMHGTIVVK
jgi:plastocyanin